MGRLAIVVAAVVLGLALIAGACVKPTPVPAPAQKSTVPMPWEKWPVEQIPSEWGWPEFFVANGTATYYADAVALAQLVKKYTPMKTQAVDMGSGVKGVMAVIKGDALFNNVEPKLVNEAFLGTGDFKDAKPGLIRMLAWPNSGNPFGMFIRPGSGIRTPYDLKGKRVAYPPLIPLFGIVNDAILEVYGMSRKDIAVVPYTAIDGLPGMLRENLVDMFVYTVSPRSPMATEMTTTGDAYLLGIDPDKIDAVVKATRYYTQEVVPAGSFKGQDKPLYAVSAFNGMHIRGDVPESLAYTVTRILWQYIDEFHSMSSAIGKQYVSPDAAVAPKVMKAGFHAGAVRYYREAGVWGAEQEKIQQEFEGMLKKNLEAYDKR